MNIGMLWFDNDKEADLASKVQRAAAYYRSKYGDYPDVCYVNPCMLSTATAAVVVAGVEMRASKTIMPGYFWIGKGTK